MKLAGPMSLHVEMVNVYNKDGFVMVMTTVVMEAMRSSVQHRPANPTATSPVLTDIVSQLDGAATATLIALMVVMKW